MAFDPLAVAVLDGGGHVVSAKREDGSGILRFEIAYGKAWGSPGMGFGTREITQRAVAMPSFIGASSQGRIIPSPGGVLILDENDHVVGVSGDAGDDDEVCALAGIATADLAAAPGKR